MKYLANPLPLLLLLGCQSAPPSVTRGDIHGLVFDLDKTLACGGADHAQPGEGRAERADRRSGTVHVFQELVRDAQLAAYGERLHGRDLPAGLELLATVGRGGAGAGEEGVGQAATIQKESPTYLFLRWTRGLRICGCI